MNRIEERNFNAENVVRKMTGQSLLTRPTPPIDYSPQSSETGYRWIENVTPALRVGKVHEITSDGRYDREYIGRNTIDHTGWCIDPDFGETVCGLVIQLPAKDRKRRYIPAISDPSNDNCALADFTAMSDCLEDTMRRADRMAEKYAEEEREYRESQEEVEEIEEEVEECAA